MATYVVEVADHVDPERALSALNRFAQTLAMSGRTLVAPLPDNFPDGGEVELAFRIRYEIDKMTGEVPAGPV